MSHVLKYTGVFGGIQGLNVLMSIVRNKIVAVLLGPEGTGLINVFNNITQLIARSTNMGLPISGVQGIAKFAGKEHTAEAKAFAALIRTWSVLTGSFGMLVCLALAFPISFWTFRNAEHLLDIAILSPAILFMAITGGEMAILKGLGRAKRVALATITGSLTTFFICIPIYAIWGLGGVSASLVMLSAAVCALTVHFSHDAMPWQVLTKGKALTEDSIPLLRLGIGYIIAGFIGQGAEWIIRASLIEQGGIGCVGLYTCGYVMMVSYASIVFVALDADFFPRLSAAADDRRRANHIINQQVQACVLLMSPILIGFTMVMPLAVRLLYSGAFLPAVPMAIAAIAYMFFSALFKPAAYLPLANGDSKNYMIAEFIYAAFIAVAVPVSFAHWGLLGAGFALSASGVVEMLYILIAYRMKYGYILEKRLISMCLIQFVLLATAVAFALFATPALKYGIVAVCLVASSAISFTILWRETDVINKIKSKFRS